jgi:hypothetical protein
MFSGIDAEYVTGHVFACHDIVNDNQQSTQHQTVSLILAPGTCSLSLPLVSALQQIPVMVPVAQHRQARRSRQVRPAQLWCVLKLSREDAEPIMHQLTEEVRLAVGTVLGEFVSVIVRGRGSGFLEKEGIKEAPIPLEVAFTADASRELSFRRAVEQVMLKLDQLGSGSTSFWEFGDMTLPAHNVLQDLIALRS